MPPLRELLMLLLTPPPDAVGFAAPGGPSIALFSTAAGTPPATERGFVGSSSGAREAQPTTASPDLDEVIREFTPAVYRLARSVVRDPGLADDVTQDTFIKVWKHLDDYRGEGSLRGWVLRIAHNTAVSTLRRVKDTATDPTKLPDDRDPISTNRVVEGRLALDDLQDALDRLDELSREIIVLREVEGLTYEEIAEALDVPVPTVKTRLLRGRRKLANSLEGWRS